jgi:hypothetical protein
MQCPYRCNSITWYPVHPKAQAQLPGRSLGAGVFRGEYAGYEFLIG